jgi:hypothetical protein
MTALGRQEKWEDSPEGYPQTPPYEWWIWHDEPHRTDPDRPGLAVDDRFQGGSVIVGDQGPGGRLAGVVVVPDRSGLPWAWCLAMGACIRATAAGGEYMRMSSSKGRL